jgi:hypothetical protein
MTGREEALTRRGAHHACTDDEDPRRLHNTTPF